MNADQPPSMLFVPGALNGGAIWRDNFMSYFESAGFEVDTLDFPSRHARGLKRQTLSLTDYRQHLVEKIQSLSAPPIIVAHSLGGLISLQAMERVPVSAIALLSPVPPDGIWRSLVSLSLRSPISAAKLAAVITDARVAKTAEAPTGMFSQTSLPDKVTTMTNNLRSESLLALTQALRQSMPNTKASVPLHFFGATGDYIIPAHEVRRAAQMYDAPVTIYEGMSHAFQVERDWSIIAQDILEWLKKARIINGDPANRLDS